MRKSNIQLTGIEKVAAAFFIATYLDLSFCSFNNALHIKSNCFIG